MAKIEQNIVQNKVNINDLKLTDDTDAPFTMISSANLTLDGFFFNRSFLAAVSRADFLDD